MRILRETQLLYGLNQHLFKSAPDDTQYLV